LAVGSIAVRRFIEERQPLLTLHGHIHESARLTGDWRESYWPNSHVIRRSRRTGARVGAV